MDPERLHLLLKRFRQAADRLERDLGEFMGAMERIIPED